MSALNSLVSESIDVVVHTARTSHGPRVTEIITVEDQASGPDSTAFTVTEMFGRTRPDAEVEWTGHLPVRALRAFRDAGIDVRDLLGPAPVVADRPTNRFEAAIRNVAVAAP